MGTSMPACCTYRAVFERIETKLLCFRPCPRGRCASARVATAAAMFESDSDSEHCKSGSRQMSSSLVPTQISGEGGLASSQARADLFTAGFPCQPWSHMARKRDAPDTHPLFEHFEIVVSYTRRTSPRLALLDNVLGLFIARFPGAVLHSSISKCS